MIKQIEETCIQRLLPHLVQECMSNGKRYSPRNLDCIELRPFTFHLDDPMLSLYPGYERKMNYRFWAIETMGYIAGLKEKWYTDLLVASNKKYSQFLNEQGELLGAYGPEIRKSIHQVTELLRKDPNTRQAVMCLWSPGVDDKIHANTMCTVMLHFFKVDYGRGAYLDLQVYMRSNDLNWGTTYDVPAFCMIQHIIAGCLGWKLGRYNHTTGSLHLYEDHMPKISFTEQTLLADHILYSFPQFPNYGTDKLEVTAIVSQMESYLRHLQDYIFYKHGSFEGWRHPQEDNPDIGEELRKWYEFWGTCIRFTWKRQLEEDAMQEMYKSAGRDALND